MKIGYSHNKPIAALREAGAEKIFYDTSKLRTERASMFKLAIRAGDTLLIYSLRNLGGSPTADRAAQAIVDSAGALIHIVDEPKGARGRPPVYDMAGDVLGRMRSVWLDCLLTEADRFQQCEQIAGRKLKRAWLYHKFGSIKNPKT